MSDLVQQKNSGNWGDLMLNKEELMDINTTERGEVFFPWNLNEKTCIWCTEGTQTVFHTDVSSELLLSFALKALQKPGQLKRGPNSANMFCFGFSLPHFSSSTQQLELLFFFSNPCKVAKACKPLTRVYAGANRLIPLGHELIKSKTWSQIRNHGCGTDKHRVTVDSDKIMTTK